MKSRQKEKKLFNKVKNFFGFLVRNYNFTIIKESIDAYPLIIYRNSFVQIGIAASEGYFHAEIRRLINGIPARYSDPMNSIGCEDIAIFESNHNYDHFDYYPVSRGLDVVLENTTKLFKRNIQIFTTNRWLDMEKVEELKDKDFYKNFGIKNDKNKKSFIQMIYDNVHEILIKKGFILIEDSRELPPYDSDHSPDHFIYKQNKDTLIISQEDWRDEYYIYYIKLNDEKIFEVDLIKYGNIEKALNDLVNAIEKIK